MLGGMQKHSYYLCKYFAHQKIFVDLYHFNQSELDINKLDVFTEEEKQYIRSVVLQFPSGTRGFGHYLKDSFKYSELVFEAVKPHLQDYDFIYTKGFSGWKLIEEKHSGKIKCCKIGVKFHGYEMFQRAPDLRSKIQQILLLRKPVKQLSQRADVVFSYGGKITDIIKQIGVKPEKIIELPSGVELNAIASSIHVTSSPIKLVYLGRYERRKGVEELNKALSELSKDLNFEFHFIGPIPDEKKLKLNRIKYHGEIRDKQILNALLRTCDVLVCPSWSEGLPNVILEAMSNGLTVLATDVGATNVLVNSRTGWLMKEASCNELKHQLKLIISSDVKLVDEKKQNALELIRSEFVWEVLIKKLIEKISF